MRVIGMGNPWRRDDGAGPEVARRLRKIGADAVEQASDGTMLMRLWEGHDDVIIVDIARSNAAPGTIHHFDAIKQKLPRDCFYHTSHTFGVAEAVETARILGKLPKKLTVIGIEGIDFTIGEGFTLEVTKAIEQVVDELSADILEERNKKYQIKH